MLTPTAAVEYLRAVNDQIAMRMTKSKAVPKPLKSPPDPRSWPHFNRSSPRDGAILQ
ncbi:hypothetical protein [Massilia sp. Bi118]|uniref:hypothetical protein n=1 Tax=Massilia sp. Bi118 TaxID=2822346 RepID=UPI001E5EE98E|nr:hypothetical protein [Massilia sp. Bi118]